MNTTGLQKNGPITQEPDWISRRPDVLGCDKSPALCEFDYASVGISKRLTTEEPDRILSRSDWLDHAEVTPVCFVVASCGGLSEEYRHGGPGFCLDDGQMEDERVPSQGGHGDALLRHMTHYLT